MSIISELIKNLRNHSVSCDTAGDSITRDLLKEAADTIEMLSEKAKPREWTLCSKKMPENFERYLIMLESGDVCRCEFNPDFIDEEHESGAFTYYHQYFDQATLGMYDEEEEAVDAVAWMPDVPDIDDGKMEVRE